MMEATERDKLNETVETAAMLFSVSNTSSRIALMSMLRDLPLFQCDRVDELDFDLEEARYRLRAMIHDESRRTLDLLEVVGE